MRVLAHVFLASALCAPAADVLTHHNDPARTGALLDETALAPATLRSEGFGRLFSLVVDGQIYAQPLVVSGIEVPGRGRLNVVYVATMRNVVYAYNADGGDTTPIWRTALGLPMPYDRIPKDAGARLGQYNIRPYIGIASTPVIDRDRRRMYVVAKIAEPMCPGVEEATAACPVVYRVHAIDIVTGEVVRRAEIDLPMSAPGVPARDVARRHLQRAALLLANGRLYAAFGAHQDAPPYQGWIASLDPDTLRPADPIFCVTPGGDMGGIWQAGSGPAVDESGHLYVMTGNGAFDPAAKQYAMTLLKLSPDLKPVAWFAPADVRELNKLDVDFGSAGPLVLPGTNQVVGGGKDGKIYVLNRTAPGGLQQRSWWRRGTNPPDQFFQASRPWRISWLSWFPLLFNVGYHHIHGSPVFWNGPDGGTLYVWPEEDRVRAYRYDAARGKFDTSPRKGIMGNRGMPGGFLSISANGARDGILWGAIPYEDDAWVQIVRGSLRAFDAVTLDLLWSSDGDDPADHFDFAKNVPPTIANGKVYLATFSDRLNVYGLHSPLASAAVQPPPKVSKDPRHRGHRKGATGHVTHTGGQR